MKLNILKMSMFAFLITGMLMSCNDTPAENVEEAEENVVEAQQELEEARQDSMEYVTYRTEAERKLDENDQKIAALKERQRTAAKEVDYVTMCKLISKVVEIVGNLSSKNLMKILTLWEILFPMSSSAILQTTTANSIISVF
jgi:CHASE3 domain sensor protein